MSRIADELYFAPKIKFRDLDLTGKALPKQFRQRIFGFYLEPALILANNCAFASGLLVVCAMDALAIYIQGTSDDRVSAICRKIPELASDENAHIFCECFRNGLVHQGKVKNGCEFSIDIECVAKRIGERLVVNPKLLAEAVLKLLDDYVKFLNRNPQMKTAFTRKIDGAFHIELND